MKDQNNIGKIVAISLGATLILGSGVYFLVTYLKQRKQEDEIVEKTPKNTNQYSGASSQSSTSKYTTEHIRRMQSYLLNIGINYGNNEIIDAIQLTGGIDGIIGDGFRFALAKAIEIGYLKSEQQLATLAA